MIRSSLIKTPVWFGLLALLAILSGCATNIPAPHDREAPTDDQDRLVMDLGLTDARYQNIAGFEHLKVDQKLRRRIHSYPHLADIGIQKAFIRDFLTTASGLNDRFMSEAVFRVPPRELEGFIGTHHEDMDLADEAGTPQERFLGAYHKHANKELELELKGVTALREQADIDAYWYKIVSGMEPSIKTKGRVKRLLYTAPFVPFIQGWILYHSLTDDRAPHAPEFAHSQTYLPPHRQKKVDPGQLRDWALLEHYAPVVVQEQVESPAYSPKSDLFGEVYLSGQSLSDITPGVNTDRPTLYAYQEEKEIQGVRVRQLIYTLWYPEHPAMHFFDPEAGPMEGWSLRITLNRYNQPLFYESVSNCGCYYKAFPTDRLESWSRSEFQDKESGKTFFLERNVTGIDAVVPELVDAPKGPPQRPSLFYSAGRHQLVTIRLESQLVESGAAAEGRRYSLLPYERLENLPYNSHRASLFGEDGLVRKAHRSECTLLAPSGLYHAGHPRQRGTQLIYFDQAEFDDPALFEKYFRLPKKAFNRPL